MAMEQRYVKALLKRADLPGDRRLTEIESLPCMGETTSLSYGMKNTKFIPIHLILYVPCKNEGASPLNTPKNRLSYAFYALLVRNYIKILLFGCRLRTGL